jgi:hypothetical protein
MVPDYTLGTAAGLCLSRGRAAAAIYLGGWGCRSQLGLRQPRLGISFTQPIEELIGDFVEEEENYQQT